MDVSQTIEFARHAVLAACLCGLFVSASATLAVRAARMLASGPFRKLRQRHGVAALAVLSVVMIFNGYPTNADKARAGAQSGTGIGHASTEAGAAFAAAEPGLSFQARAAEDFADSPTFPAWTNALDSLCITGIALGQTSVWMRASRMSRAPIMTS